MLTGNGRIICWIGREVRRFWCEGREIQGRWWAENICTTRVTAGQLPDNTIFPQARFTANKVPIRKEGCKLLAGFCECSQMKSKCCFICYSCLHIIDRSSRRVTWILVHVSGLNFVVSMAKMLLLLLLLWQYTRFSPCSYSLIQL